jgi:hypothetical protein
MTTTVEVAVIEVAIAKVAVVEVAAIEAAVVPSEARDPVLVQAGPVSAGR